MSKWKHARSALVLILLISVTVFLLYSIWWLAVQIMLSRLGVVA